MAPPPESQRRRRSDARQNRAAIVAAAARQLRGEGNLNMQKLAVAAGVSRSTLYRHFPTRASLEEGLRREAAAAAGGAIEDAVSGAAPPLALLRRLVAALVEVGSEYSLDRLGTLTREQIEVAPILPLLDALRKAAEVSPAPPREWLLKGAGHLVEACLLAGADEPGAPNVVAGSLFRTLSEPLDQGLAVLDHDGSLLCANARARRLVEPEGRLEVLYEDGSPCPPEAYPLVAAVRTQMPQSGVRGHRDPSGVVKWVAVDAHPLGLAGEAPPYGFLGVLSDITAERDWQLRRLRPAGRLRGAHALPLDIARVLDEIPPHLFPEQFASEARRIAGGPVALYVLDIDGTRLLRLAGPEDFPEDLEAPLALGPELAEDGIPDLRARLERDLPGITMAPMWLRGRAIGVLLALGADEEPLVELGRHGAAAMELAGGYTDVIDAARRRKETRAAAELQQSLLPPRIARMGGGELAGSVLPSYEVGGDWFDYVENRDGAWIAVADAAGKGATAGALGSIALAALRAARRSEQSLEEAAQTMHEVVSDVGRPEFFLTAIVARWNAVYSVFSWINCGHPPPLIVRGDDTIEQLATRPELPLGLFERERRFVRRQRRIEEDERLILHSDGITARKTPDGLFGLDGVERAVRRSQGRSATAIARSIQEAVMRATDDPLQDDAVAIVLSPTSGPGRG